MKRAGKIAAALRRLACDQRGASTVEYMLLLAFIGIPSLITFRLLLNVMAAYYNIVIFVETLPMP